jgi:hypothetical protein
MANVVSVQKNALTTLAIVCQAQVSWVGDISITKRLLATFKREVCLCLTLTYF